MAGRGSGRGRLAAVLGVLAVGAVVVPAEAATCPAHRRGADGWTRIAAPAFPSGGATLTGYDAADFAPGDLVVTNGRSLAASTDGGCTWRPATVPADGPAGGGIAAGEDAEVVGHAVTQVRFGYGRAPAVWAIGQTELAGGAGGAGATVPRVLVSGDRGRTFAAAVEGLPPVGRPLAVRGLPGRGALLLFRRLAPFNDHAVYATADGRAWTLRWGGLRGVGDLAVDWLGRATAEGPTVWLWGGGGLYRGRLGADAPHRVATVGTNVHTVDLAPVRDEPTAVFAYYAGSAERAVSTDGGATFVAEPSPQHVQSASSYQPLPGVRAVSSLETNVLLEAPGRPGGVDLSPAGARVADVQFVAAAEPEGMPLYAFEPRALYRRHVPFDLVAPPPPDPRAPVDVDVRRRAVVPPRPRIEPRGAVVRLRPGGRRTVDFRVTLPPVPTPLDLFFMTDSTGSMTATIAGVQRGVQGVVDGLAAAGIDLRVGVADFRDYPARPNDGNYPYRRRRPVGPTDADLAEALGSITTGGGTSDGHDAGLEAIYQAATGAGRTDPLGARGQLIPPGLDAEFRPGTLQVVLVAADDNFRHPETNPGYPGPSLVTVAAALRERGIHLVGLHVDSGSGSAKADMAALARATGTLAPAGGVDCDGDGRADVAPGAPLVCDFDPKAADTLPKAFVAMLSAIEDRADVDLAVTGAPRFARATGALHHPDVNVKARNAFTLPVEFRCPRGDAGSRTRVRVSAASRGAELVATTATLECVAPAPRVEEAGPVVPPTVLRPLVPPPPPPPAPGGHANPNVHPNVNPNPNPQVNGNGGFATQEDEEFQLALANNEGALPDDELAMSGLDRAVPPVPALAWAAALAMTGAAAYGLRGARRARPAPAYARQEHR